MPGKPTPEEIRARLRVVCICKGITLGRIVDAITAGAASVEEVNRATGSGSGGCAGDSGVTRCRPVIQELLRTGGRLPVQTPPQPAEQADDFWLPTPVRKAKAD